MFGINGLLYISEYLTQAEETRLTKLIDKQVWDGQLKRRVQHYGYRYDYKARTVTEDMFLGELPKWLKNYAKQLFDDGLCEVVPDQVIVNEYQPGQGISAHVDCIKCFGPRIFSISLGSQVIMEFTQSGKPKKEILLAPILLIMMYGEARAIWKHGIPGRATDRGVARGRRISLTFRNVNEAI